jgi:hypothetical protein
MLTHRRAYVEGGSYFFTVVTFNRLPILTTDFWNRLNGLRRNHRQPGEQGGGGGGRRPPLLMGREQTLAVLINLGEFKRLELAVQTGFHLTQAFSQDEALLECIRRGETHPVMAAFGLWRAADDLEKFA